LALPKLGHAKLKGLSLEVVPADLVRIKIKMHKETLNSSQLLVRLLKISTIN